TQSFTWQVTSPISITDPGTQTDAEGDTVSLSVVASGGGTLSYAALGLPAGLLIDAATGDITGDIAVGAAASGPYFVTVIVEDGTSITTKTFQWEVTSPVTITAVADQQGAEGATVSLQIEANGPGALTYGAVGLPDGLVIDPQTGEISGTLAAGA